MDEQFKKWSRRSLSTLGKILIAKTFGISQLIYALQSIVVNESDYKCLNQILYKFIWNKHYLAAKAPERISREITNKPIKYGGFGMLDIAELDASLKIRALGRMMETKHPFLSLVRAKLELSDFFYPNCSNSVEPVTNQGIELLKIDRQKLWSNVKMVSNTRFVSLMRNIPIKKAVNRTGRQGLTYFNIIRAGKLTIGDLNREEIQSLRRFVDKNLIESALKAPNVNLNLATENLDKAYVINEKFIPLAKLTSKEIRTSRSDRLPIRNFKSGLEIPIGQLLTWLRNLSKLASTRHKNTLLRIIHRDIYTKEKLCRYNLIDNSICPRCNEIETFEHKILECTYVRLIWKEVLKITKNRQRPINIETAIAAYTGNNPTIVTVHAEILSRLIQLRENQNWLLRPKIFVKAAIQSLCKIDKKIDTSLFENLI
jgi:hypothetical protein